MINTEKTLLGTVIEFPALMPVFLENCTKDLFTAIDSQATFIMLVELNLREEKIDWPLMFDVLKLKVSTGFISELMSHSRAIAPSDAENWMIEKIEKLKRNRARKLLLKKISEEVDQVFPDFEKIIEIAEQAKVIRMVKEKPDFESAYNEYLDWKERKRTNINLGIPSFDKRTDDYNFGEVIGIMARTFVGKTFLAVNILNHLINKTPEKIGFFTLEMPKSTLMERILQVFYGMSRYEIRDKGLYTKDFLSTYENINIYSRIYSVSEMSRIIDRDGLKIIFIDYLQLIKKTRGKSLYEETTYQVEEIKQVAKDKEVVVFLLSQLSRKGGGGWEAVTIDMARGSGAIEENCDFLIGIWDPGLAEDSGPEWDDKIIMKLLKNKRGSTIKIETRFDKNSGKIGELKEED